jgi:hypothetical protein
MKNINKINLKWVLGAFFVTACAYLVILGVVFIYFSYTEIKNNNDHAKLLLKLKNVETLAYVRNNRDNYGADTPAGTIYMYYEFLESQQYPLASTFFTRETRMAHLEQLKDISEPNMRKFVEVLRIVEKESMGIRPEGDSFKLSSPINVEFKKVPGYAGAPVWQIESMDYRLP